MVAVSEHHVGAVRKDDVSSVTARRHVSCAVPKRELVCAAAAPDHVLPGAADEHVVAGEPEERVVTVPSRIRSALGVPRIVSDRGSLRCSPRPPEVLRQRRWPPDT